MISSKHKTIFIHIPKVAGQSIETMFLNDLGLDWKSRHSLLLRKKKPKEKGPSRLAHLRARDYVEFGYIDQVDFDEYFKFSFVRNPYSRTYSYYRYLGYANIMKFKDFVQEILRKKIDNNHFFFLSQSEYLYDKDGKKLVDFVGKLETIEDDINEVIKRANLRVKELPHVNKSKNELTRGLSKIIKNPLLLMNLHTNNKPVKDYTKMYDHESEKIVRQYYHDDLVNFNYKFGE